MNQHDSSDFDFGWCQENLWFMCGGTGKSFLNFSQYDKSGAFSYIFNTVSDHESFSVQLLAQNKVVVKGIVENIKE